MNPLNGYLYRNKEGTAMKLLVALGTFFFFAGPLAMAYPGGGMLPPEDTEENPIADRTVCGVPVTIQQYNPMSAWVTFDFGRDMLVLTGTVPTVRMAASHFRDFCCALGIKMAPGHGRGHGDRHGEGHGDGKELPSPDHGQRHKQEHSDHGQMHKKLANACHPDTAYIW